MVRFTAILVCAALAAAVVGCKKPDTAPRSDTAGDRDRLQGTWAIEAFDDGRPADPGDLEDLKSARLKFEGDTVTLPDGEGDKFTFALDEGQTPKVMTLTEVVGAPPRRGVTAAGGTRKDGRPPAGPAPAREPEKLVWVYKFEGDALVIAFTKDGLGEKPTEFKGGAEVGGRRVTVVTLKKTDAPPPPRRFTTTAVRYGTKK